MEFVLIKNYLDEPEASVDLIPLPNVSGKCLSTMIQYCKAHVDFRGRNATEEDIKTYERKFVKGLDSEMLKELLLGANYLEVKYLLDLLCRAIADIIKNKSVEYVRGFFAIDNDYTPEEEEKLRSAYAWAFEGVEEGSYN